MSSGQYIPSLRLPALCTLAFEFPAVTDSKLTFPHFLLHVSSVNSKECILGEKCSCIKTVKEQSDNVSVGAPFLGCTDHSSGSKSALHLTFLIWVGQGRSEALNLQPVSLQKLK